MLKTKQKSINKTVISDKYQVVIPKAVRNRLGLRVGQEVTIHPLVDQSAVLMLPKNGKSNKPWYEQMAGLGKEVWTGIDPVEYVRALRSGWENRATRG